MDRIFFLAILACMVVTCSCAIAEDQPGSLPATQPDAAAAAPQATAASQTPVPAAPPKVVRAELKDGTKIETGEDGTVTLINADGSKTPAPDGIFTLRNNTTFNVKDGVREDQ